LVVKGRRADFFSFPPGSGGLLFLPFGAPQNSFFFLPYSAVKCLPDNLSFSDAPTPPVGRFLVFPPFKPSSLRASRTAVCPSFLFELWDPRFVFRSPRFLPSPSNIALQIGTPPPPASMVSEIFSFHGRAWVFSCGVENPFSPGTRSEPHPYSGSPLENPLRKSFSPHAKARCFPPYIPKFA